MAHKMTIDIPESLWKALKKKAKEQLANPSVVVRRLVADWVAIK